MKPITGAITIFGGVLTGAVAVFRIVPYVKAYRVEGDDVAEVVAIVGIIVWLVATQVLLMLAGVGWVRRKLGTRPWSDGVRSVQRVAWGWCGVYILGALPASSIGPLGEPPTSVRFLAAWFFASVAGAAYLAIRQWKDHRDERELQCPWCKEWVHLEATRCRYCGSDTLDMAGAQVARESREPAVATS
jgi:hypothetical protein